MFEDIEIKSFKEYITEQELLKELNANDPLDDEDYYANDDDNNDDGINAGAKSAAEIPSNGKSDKPKQKPTVTEPEREPEIDNSNFLGVSKPISLKIDSSLSPIEVRAKLREQYNNQRMLQNQLINGLYRVQTAPQNYNVNVNGTMYHDVNVNGTMWHHYGY